MTKILNHFKKCGYDQGRLQKAACCMVNAMGFDLIMMLDADSIAANVKYFYSINR